MQQRSFYHHCKKTLFLLWVLTIQTPVLKTLGIGEWVSRQIVPAAKVWRFAQPSAIITLESNNSTNSPKIIDQIAAPHSQLTYQLVTFAPQILSANAPLVLYLVGNTSSAWHEQGLFLDLAQQSQCPVLCINYPGVAGSQGFPDSLSTCAEAIVAQLQQILATHNWNHRQVLVMGHSLGGYIGAQVAAKLQAPLFVQRSLISPAIVGSKSTSFSYGSLKLLSSFYGWESNPVPLIEQLAASGKRCVVANHENDYLMAPNVVLEPSQINGGQAITNGPQDARIMPKPSQNLVLLELTGGGSNAHNALANYVQIKNQKPTNSFLGSPQTLWQAMLTFIKIHR